jgi:hypothetical protein
VAAPLFLGKHTVRASRGVQQGDPLSTVLFAVVLDPLLRHIQQHHSLNVAAILDDVTCAGSLSETSKALEYLHRIGPEFGLLLSPKTIIWSPSQHPISIPINPLWSIASGPSIPLLGGLLSTDVHSFTSFFRSKISIYQSHLEVLTQLHDPQLELLLIRACLGASKFNYLLRITPPSLISQALDELEAMHYNAIHRILVDNHPGFQQFHFSLATLPIRLGGLGLSNPRDISHFAYTASIMASYELQQALIPSLSSQLPFEYDHSIRQYHTFIGTVITDETVLPQLKQKTMATEFFQVKHLQLLSDKYLTEQPTLIQQRFYAILMSFQQPYASAYLFALPNHGFNQVMTPLEFHSHMALRLLLPIYSGEHNCSRRSCYKSMDSFGYHAICCTGSALTARHDIVARAFHDLALNAKLHPRWQAPVACLGPSWRSTGRQSSGITAFRPADVEISWDHSYRRTCVDITVVSPILAYMPRQFKPGIAARNAANKKLSKHLLPCETAGLDFLPLALDCFGVLAPTSKHTLRRLALALESSKGFPSYLAKQIVFRRISFAVHLGTARQLTAHRENFSLFSSFSSPSL